MSKVHKNGSGLHEMERKYALPDGRGVSERMLRNRYTDIYDQIRRNRSSYPDISHIFGRMVARSGEQKDTRFRLYFSDENFILPQKSWELRLEMPPANRLMIKFGRAANDNDHTLDRVELRYQMLRPSLGCLADIKKNSQKKKNKKADRYLGQIYRLFNSAQEPLYPVVSTVSSREKLIYFRPASYNGADYSVVLELALDTGYAHPMGGGPYLVDQIELEAKAVLDMDSGADVLADPKCYAMNTSEIRSHIINPVMDEEDNALIGDFGLIPVFSSKPARGIKIAEDYMSTRAGMTAAKKMRTAHLNASFLRMLHAGNLQSLGWHGPGQ